MIRVLLLGILVLGAPAPAELERMIELAAAAHDVDPTLVAAIVQVESAGDPAAIGAAGELGLMQILPTTIELIAANTGADVDSIATDPAANLIAGTWYLRRQLDRFDQDPELALAAYNAGPGAVIDAGNKVPAIAEHYVDRVYRAWNRTRPEPAAWPKSASKKSLKSDRSPGAKPPRPAPPPKSKPASQSGGGRKSCPGRQPVPSRS